MIPTPPPPFPSWFSPLIQRKRYSVKGIKARWHCKRVYSLPGPVDKSAKPVDNLWITVNMSSKTPKTEAHPPLNWIATMQANCHMLQSFVYDYEFFIFSTVFATFLTFGRP